MKSRRCKCQRGNKWRWGLKRTADNSFHQTKNFPFIGETHLFFLRMDIHIDLFRRKRKEKDKGGIQRFFNPCSISHLHSLCNQGGKKRPFIHKKNLFPPLRL